MARSREWYRRLIGYEFSYNGRGLILEDLMYYEDGKTCYMMRWSDGDGAGFICDYKQFKEYISQTDYPRK